MSSMSNSLYNRIHEQTPNTGSQPILELSGSSEKSSKLLNFDKAMEDFRNMFPHLDPDVIETVLRANEGVVQVTIDQLLVLSEETTSDSGNDINTSLIDQHPHIANDNKPRLPGYSESLVTPMNEEPPPAYSEIDASPSGQGNGKYPFGRVPDLSKPHQTKGHVSRSSVSGQWTAALIGTLPDDFLRLSVENVSPAPSPSNAVSSEQRNSRVSDGHFYSDDQVEQFLEDEKLAMFLQNEEFIRELRHNPDFILSLEEDHRQYILKQNDTGHGGGTSTEHPSPPPSGGARPKITASQEDVVFRHKLKHMGKTTRRKFGKLAKRFSRKKSVKTPLHGESTANLLEDEMGDEELQGIDSMTPIAEDDNDGRMTSPESDRSPREEQLHNRMAGRRLPPVPTSRSPSNDEPIVFYSEDNEFAYKAEN